MKIRDGWEGVLRIDGFGSRGGIRAILRQNRMDDEVSDLMHNGRSGSEFEVDGTFGQIAGYEVGTAMLVNEQHVGCLTVTLVQPGVNSLGVLRRAAVEMVGICVRDRRDGQGIAHRVVNDKDE